MSILSINSNDADGTDFVSNTDFTIRLKKPLQQVVGFSLLEAIIPFSWYPVRDLVFPWNTSSFPFDDPPKEIVVPDGHYTVPELIAKLNSLGHGGTPASAKYWEFAYDVPTNKISIKSINPDGAEQYIHYDAMSVRTRQTLEFPSHKLTCIEYVSANNFLDATHFGAPRTVGSDALYVQMDLMLDSQNTKHYSGSRIMIPVTVPPLGIIHYSVDADEESIPLTVYQNIQNIRFTVLDAADAQPLPGTRGQPIYLRIRFHFRH